MDNSQEQNSGHNIENGEICTLASVLKEYLRVHTKEKPFSCSICPQTFTSNGSLKRHQLIHTGEKPFSCSTCQRTFTTKSSLKIHMQIHTGEKPYSCHICSKRFRCKFYLSKHIKAHTDGKAFTCTMCSKAFLLKCNLVVHMRTHTNKKPFSCTVCPKAFIHKSDLKRHELIHTDEKPFSCSVCAKTFRVKYSLDKHMGIHTDEKPYSCSRCSEAFRFKNHLMAHLQIHTIKKLFSCPRCSEAFSLKRHLMTHLGTHTDEGHSTCTVCSKSYKCKTSFKKHMKIHEEETPRRSTNKSPSTSGHGNAVGLEKHRCTHDYRLRPRTFNQEDQLSVHVDNEHPYECQPVCGYEELTRRKDQVRNEIVESLQCTHDCRLCPQTFNREDQLSVHVDNEHPYACQPVCGYEELTRRKDQVQNEIVEFLQRTHDCRLCPQTFNREDQLSVHVDNEHPYACQPVCGYEELTRRKDQVRNEIVESLQCTRNCRLCPRTFNQEDQLSVHVDNEHPYECQPVCGYEELTRRKDQVRNEMVESLQRTHDCRLCPQTFNREDQLSVHVDNEHPYACQPVYGYVEWMKRKCHSHSKR